MSKDSSSIKLNTLKLTKYLYQTHIR